MFRVVYKFFEVPRAIKRLITLVFDFLFVLTALFCSLLIRVGEDWERWFDLSLVYVCLFLVSGSIAIWVKLGLYKAVIRYLDIIVLAKILWGSLASVFLLVISLFIFDAILPRSIPFIYFSLILIFVAGSRLLVRGLILSRDGSVRVKVAIYGAGSAGRQLCLSLQNGVEYQPIFFIDEDNQLIGTMFCGIMVYPPSKIGNLIGKCNIQKILVAIPSASKLEKRSIFSRLQKYSVEILTIPGSAELVSGKVNVNQLRNIDIADLLGRDEIPPKDELLSKCILGKNVLVTGAGGSIGAELCRQIAKLQPSTLILLDISEYNLYELERELRGKFPNLAIKPVLGNVQDKLIVDNVVSNLRINTIYHAAAYKHVPLVEENSSIGVLNNVWGTKTITEAALKFSVESFVLVSTDKAVRPTNVMGASKRLAEMIVQNMAELNGSTVFSLVRFGNVLGSSGSVIPLFKKQIEEGGPVTVTHPNVTRYFMTIPEAASLVIQAGAMATGGEVFVLDMGQPVKIRDLAENMINLMGLSLKTNENPEGDIEMVYSGLRAGEKLYEELLIGDDVQETSHPRIMKANESKCSCYKLEERLNAIQTSIKNDDNAQLRKLLSESELGFNPSTNSR